jgi:hypothetical protein
VIDELLSTSRNDAGVAVVFFYFDYTGSVSIHEVVLSIIKQLVMSFPQRTSMPEEVVKISRLIRLGRIPTLGSLVDTVARCCAKFQRTTIVFDGLDEFTGDGLLSLLQMLKDAPCKLFAASRDGPSFQELFEDSAHIFTHVHPSDITLYTSQMIRDNPDVQELLDERLQEDITNTFLSYSENT